MKKQGIILISLMALAFLVPLSVAADVNDQVHILKGKPGSGGSTGPQVTPWGITRINAIDAAATVNGGAGINVAVLDTGLDIGHEDLQGLNVVWGFSFYKGNRAVSGVECTPSNWKSCDDGQGHGTHVTGTIAAQDNSIGVIGVATNVNIYTIKVLSDRGSGSYSAIANGIIAAVNGPDGIVGTSDDADVLSMSLGGPSSTAELENAVNYAISNGAVIVAATGNDGASTPSYPAALPGVLKVGAMDDQNQIAYFSNRGEDIFAPGVAVLSTTGGSYESWAGTSMATPHVAGVVALAWAAHPNYSQSQIMSLVIGSGDAYNMVNAAAVV